MSKFRCLLLPFTLSLLATSGCSTNAPTQPDIHSQLKKNYEKEINERDKKIAQLENSLISNTAPDSHTTENSTDSLLPPDAKAGQCYARTLTPAVYNTENISVLKKEASERIEIIPAKYNPVEVKVLIKEQSERLEIIPAQYEWVNDKVLVSPETIKLIPVTAKYKIVNKSVLDKPEHTVWKKGNGPITKIDEATGEILCLVTVPATYKIVKKRVLTKNATTKKIIIPAKYRTIKRRTLKKEPSVRRITIPAEYKMIKARELVQPETTRKITINEEYENVVKHFKVKDSVVQWQRVLCKTNFTKKLVRELQLKLKAQNFNPGPIDGYYGKATASAVTLYQKHNKIPSGGLTLETLKTLEIDTK